MVSIINLLRDEPTTQDDFGTHSRVATAVAELIKAEKSGKAIALIGPWGSGKSSVLQMIQARLVGIADLFIFDAWTHEGDPLRRTFLETLIGFLWKDNPSAEMTKLLTEIALRKKTKEETTSPTLTWEARTLGGLLLAVPAGMTMFAAMVRMSKPSWALVSAALILALLPLLFIFVLGLGVGLRKAVTAARIPKKIAIGFAIVFSISLAVSTIAYRIWLLQHVKSLLAFVTAAVIVVIFAIYRSSTSGILPLLLNRTVTTTRSESIESAEPSSVEFQRWFRSIVALHHKSEGRQLVIAIDNLDRIDSALARQLWATMRIFFEFTSEMQPQEGRIWLLAAFDKGAIQKLWDVDDPDSFVKKTFQASFSVPSLVLIHRDDYLKKQLRAAFPFCGDPLLDPVVRLYALKHAGEISTARRIISFVNSIGSISRQWRQDEIPLINQAQYVLAGESGVDIMSILASAATGIWGPEELVGPNWQESLAAIHFNVPPSEVAHVFMPPAITNGLVSGDVRKFANLARIRGFGGVLSEVAIRNTDAWKQPQSLSNAIVALDSLGHNENDDGVNRTWRIFTAAASRIEKWDPLPQAGVALSILIRRSSNDNDQITKLLKSAGRAIPRTPDGNIDSSEKSLSGFMEAMEPVFTLLASLPLSFELIVPGPATTYLSLLKILSTKSSKQFVEIARRLGTESHDEIPNVVGDLIKKVQLNDDFYRVISVLSTHYTTMDWSPAIEGAESIFANTNSNFLQSGFKATFEMLLILSSSVEPAAKTLEKLARDGTLYHYMGIADGPPAKNLAILMLLLFSDNFEPTGQPGSARPGVSRYQQWLQNPDRASAGVIANLAAVLGQVTRLQSRKALPDPMNKGLAAVLRALPNHAEMPASN